MKKITVLGAGLVGNAIAIDFCKDYQVTAVDLQKDRLDLLKKDYGIVPLVADVSDASSLKKAIENSDLVINALPGFMGTAALRTIIENRRNVVDIAFSPEDPFDLDELAKKNRVTAVVDCGVAPGLCNLIMGDHSRQMDSINSYECLVGGLPKEREWPCEYKAVFSPLDVIEEYTRPARYIENGIEVVRPALSDSELIHLKGIATLEAFNTDGLRTLARTMNAPNMKEKTLRYPGHIQLMKALREIGFFDKKPIDINGIQISPLEYTSRILFPKWKLGENEADFTFMRVTLEGIHSGKKRKIIFELYDEFDFRSRTTSMARTTGYTCTAVARLLIEGEFSRTGICPPEFVGQEPGLFEKVLEYLQQRNIKLNISDTL